MTVVSIRRADGQTLAPSPRHVLRPEDRLIVAGTPSDMERLKAVVAGVEQADPSRA